MLRFEEMSVLERQNAVLGRLYNNQSQQNLAQFNNLISGNFMMGCLDGPIDDDQRLNNKNFINFDMFGTELHNCQEMTRPSLSNVSNSSITTASKENDHSTIVAQRENVAFTKKRKAEFYEEEDCKIKRHEGKSAELHSEITGKGQKGNNCKENSKTTEVQKQDYIHVRARRGQATDSHSLAERARREKIGKKMKYLQELVPGCNRVTGKAGMLDEIINYVQSLQKQVEFLSMKLAALNPHQNTDNFFIKDMSNYMANFATTLSEYNIIQQHQQQQASSGVVHQMLSPTTVLQQQHPTFETDLQSLFQCQL